jgi:Uma2 family endonuclease
MKMSEERTYTEDEYVERERRAETKSDFVDGVIVPRAVTMPRHNALAANVMTTLYARLRSSGSRCLVLGSDQRVRCDATRMNAYPDGSVAIGPRFFRDALVNPTVLIEVLSDATEGYDRGVKFAHYRMIPSFVDYVLVSQREHRVEHLRRLASGQWLLTVHDGDGAVLELSSIECSVPLAEVYVGADELPGDEEEHESRAAR